MQSLLMQQYLFQLSFDVHTFFLTQQSSGSLVSVQGSFVGLFLHAKLSFDVSPRCQGEGENGKVEATEQCAGLFYRSLFV